MYIRALTFLVAFLVGCAPQDTTLTNGGDTNDIVTGTGRMTLSVTELVISDIQVDYSKSGTFTIESVGDGNLQIYEIRIVADADDAFYFSEEEDIELAPGQTSDPYSVTADLSEAEPSYGELRLRTSDPDAASLILPLSAFPEGYVPPEDTGGDSGGGA
ncbi:MAG: hypothetical protein Q8P18_14610 [Pseudomonadota bacterium]|nr:hypothetical protein [Pseudomonadota bacterium]